MHIMCVCVSVVRIDSRWIYLHTNTTQSLIYLFLLYTLLYINTPYRILYIFETNREKRDHATTNTYMRASPSRRQTAAHKK